MSKKLTQEEVIRRAISVHGNTYNYSKLEYKGTDTKVCIICKKHGEFWQTPYKHINSKQDCRKCMPDKLRKVFSKNQSEIIKKASIVHENKYNYSNVKYINYHTKIEIICNFHGSFWQTPANHISSGQGCCKCNKHIGAVSEKFFKKYPNKRNIPANLYFVKFKNKDEEFYKVGLTINKVEKRFLAERNTFDIQIIDIVKTTLYEAFIKEQKFKIDFMTFQYIPINKFQGWTECFRPEIYNIMFNKSG